MANTIESILTNQAKAINKLSSSDGNLINIGNVYEMVYNGLDKDKQIMRFEMKKNDVKYDFTNKLIIFSLDFNNEPANFFGQTCAPFIISINDRDEITYENVFTSEISFVRTSDNVNISENYLNAIFGNETNDNGFEIELGTIYNDSDALLYSNPKLYVLDFMEENDNQELKQDATNILENHYQEIKKIENEVGKPFNTGRYYEIVQQGSDNTIFVPKDTSINFDFSGKIIVIITYYKQKATYYSSQLGDGFNLNWVGFLYTDTWDENTNLEAVSNYNHLKIKKDSKDSFPILDYSPLSNSIEAVQPFLYVFDFSYNNA